MNTRIKELLDQSTYEILGVKQVDQNLFANLIILECARVVFHGDPNDGQRLKIGREIKEHFDITG